MRQHGARRDRLAEQLEAAADAQLFYVRADQVGG
jgi:hypothetical protein